MATTRAALRPGTPLGDVDDAARSVIAAAGRAEQFPHGVGHCVGLEIHEAPALNKAGTGTLAAGMAVTVEPGVYVPGQGGVRIEGTLIVREGAPELHRRPRRNSWSSDARPRHRSATAARP